MSDLFLGVDGGGTKTEFVVIDGAGSVIAEATLGASYHPAIGVEAVLRLLGEGVAAVAPVPERIAFAFFGLPAFGEDRAADPLLAAGCRRLLGHDRLRVDNDMVCGWAGSLGAEDGINLVAGTGSIGYGEREATAARAGGWGELLGDEGSAYWIAREGLAAFTRMSDGRAPRGALHRLLREALALDDDLALLERTAALDRTALAALAPLVTQAAADGDPAAAAILARAAEELFALAATLRAALGYTSGERALVSGSGSIIARVAPVRARLLALLAADGFTWVEPRHPPGYGAALYARKLAG